MRAPWLSIGLALLAAIPSAAAQSPPPGVGLAEYAAMRFPQPIRAGDLVGRTVQEAVESQDRLGTVRELVHGADGTVQVVIDLAGTGLGGLLGFGRRAVAVPVEATVLVGTAVEVAAFSPGQLRARPAFDPLGTTPLPADTVLRVGLAKPSH